MFLHKSGITVHILFLTSSAAESRWSKIIQACASQYQEHLAYEEVDNMY